MVITAAVLIGLNGSISRLLFDDGITPLTLIEFRMFIGGACLMLALLIGYRKGLKVQRRFWGWVGIGILGMAIPFSLVLGSLRRINATRVGIVSMLELPAAGIIAYFWLGQRLDAWQIAGWMLVLIGIGILQYERSETLQPIE